MDKFQEQIEIPKWKGQQRRIAITGGIASGKSSIGTFLKKIKSLPVIDADVISREAIAPKTSANQEIIKRYTNIILHKNSDVINRTLLAKIIFSDDKERKWLENLLHPVIKNSLLIEIDKKKNLNTIILVIPLLFEANLTKICNEIWVVNCTHKQQLERLMARDNLTQKEAYQRIKAQWPLDRKIKFADAIIDNSGQSAAWINQIEYLLEKSNS